VIRALVWSFAVFVFLRFGLQPTGWLFYEGHFATGWIGSIWVIAFFEELDMP
jgi:hypothetical protein